MNWGRKGDDVLKQTKNDKKNHNYKYINLFGFKQPNSRDHEPISYIPLEIWMS